MLSYELLPDYAGLRLIGGFTDFSALVDVACDVAHRTPLIRNKDDTPFLSLSCLARKAYEAPQDVIDPPDLERRFAVAVDWPSLLVVSRFLRGSLAYIDHPKGHQAVAYALEAVIESALHEAFGGEAEALVDKWQRIDAHDEALLEQMDAMSERYRGWAPEQRRAHLSDLWMPAWLRGLA